MNDVNLSSEPSGGFSIGHDPLSCLVRLIVLLLCVCVCDQFNSINEANMIDSLTGSNSKLQLYHPITAEWSLAPYH